MAEKFNPEAAKAAMVKAADVVALLGEGNTRLLEASPAQGATVLEPAELAEKYADLEARLGRVLPLTGDDEADNGAQDGNGEVRRTIADFYEEYLNQGKTATEEGADTEEPEDAPGEEESEKPLYNPLKRMFIKRTDARELERARWEAHKRALREAEEPSSEEEPEA